VSFARQQGFAVEELAKLVGEQKLEIVPFTAEQALHSGDLVSITRSYGLSLGDRPCLALARLLNVPVITADKIWATLNLGVEVRLIR
jgi:PIN domain nuclease of toxin-antitoxin system